MQYQQVSISSIVPYDKNARMHSSAQVDLLAGSIQEFGFDQPIVVDINNVIIKGHCRYQAALKLGLDTVPVIIAKNLSPAQIKASRIADNRIAELSSWDQSLLDAEINVLIEDDFDVSLLGFDDDVPFESPPMIPTQQGSTTQHQDPSPYVGSIDGSAGTVSLDPRDSSTKEINIDDFKLDHECPRCGFEFND